MRIDDEDDITMIQLFPELTPATAPLLFFVTNKFNFWMHFQFFFWGPKLLMFPKQKWNRNVGFTLCINNREALYNLMCKGREIVSVWDIRHVLLESNPSQVRCEHGTWEGTCRGDADNIYINVNTYLQLVWVDVTFIFYYIGHCLGAIHKWRRNNEQPTVT